jgi:hypothetical protein
MNRTYSPQSEASSDAIIDRASQELDSDGFSLLPAKTTLKLLGCPDFSDLADWAFFCASWGDLPLDTYMADGGTYRRRRHATLSISAPSIQLRRERHQPHYQDLDFNHLNGGVERMFEPIEDKVLTGATMSGLLAVAARIAAGPEPTDDWRVEVHQFRIEIDQSGHGLPTPEGRHRDGVDLAIMVLVNRANVIGGSTRISDSETRELALFSMLDPLDMAIVDDLRVYHEVSPIQADVSGDPSSRDVLVATFRRVTGCEPPPA